MAPSAHQTAVDPVTLARLGRYDLVARMVVEGYQAGLHRGVHHGHSLEFDHHAPYRPGDDLRRVDWRVWARSDRLYLKQYEEETNMRVVLVLDASGSMNYGSAGLTKFQYASAICAAITYLAVQQHDRVGLTIAGEPSRPLIPARAHSNQFRRICDALANIQPSGPTGLAEALHQLASRLHRRSLVILLSDLLTPPEPVKRALAYFCHRKHEVNVWQILDPAERDFPFTETARFTDLETQASVTGHGPRLRAAYQSELEILFQTYRQGFQALGVDSELLLTFSPLETALGQILSIRAQKNC